MPPFLGLDGLIDYRAAVAGFFGSMVGFSCTRPMAIVGKLVTLAAGTSTAGFMTPLIVWWLKIPAGAEYGASFFIGLSTPYAIPAVERVFSGVRISIFGRGESNDSSD